jgi:hypothetical protein
MGIDRAFLNLRCHAGGFAALHLVYTPEFLQRCRRWIDQAAELAGSDKTIAARVQMTSEGLRNAEQYMQLREAMNRGDFHESSSVYSNLLARAEASQRGLGNHYTADYLKRFISPSVSAGAAAKTSSRRLVQVLPDTWKMAYDEAETGTSKGFQQAAFDDAAWREVQTYGKPLDPQDLPDRQTILWYRTTIQVPATVRKAALVFLEVDGQAEVFVNGQSVGRSAKKRQPFEVDLAGALLPGKNVVALRVDHKAMSELFLGGILRPVILTEQDYGASTTR